MPFCPQCDNRSFSNKEALLQHMKSSSVWHPFCAICDRRFVSQSAYDAHMTAKHPPTYDCITCNKSFHAPFALEDHYRGSQNHPNCVRCGRGFLDAAAREEHLRIAHPKVSCGPCGGIVIYEEALSQHYSDSSNHPSCLRCSNGFKDDSSYSEHISSAHPDLHCKTCKASFDTPEKTQMHFWTSPVHPKCDRCSMGFENEEDRDSHVETIHTATPTAGATEPASAVASIHKAEIPTAAPQETISPPAEFTPLYSTGFTPLSPKNHAQRLILGEGRIDSPDLQLQMNFSSPLTDVKPLFSPGLPRPGGIIEELWTSRENVQVPISRPQQKSTEMGHSAGNFGAAFVPGKPLWSPPSTTSQQVSLGSRSPPTASTSRQFFGNSSSTLPIFPTVAPAPRSYHEAAKSYPPSNYGAPHSFDTPRFPFRAREGRHTSPSFASQPRAEFHPRLYPGSVRQAARAGSLRRPSPPTEAALGRSSGSSGHSSDEKSIVSGYSRHNIGFGDNGTPSNLRRGSVTSENVDWRELLGSSAEKEKAELTVVDDAQRSFYEDSSQTPRDTALVTTPIMSQGTVHPATLQVQNLPTSPSLATTSSPASSALGHSPSSTRQEPETRPTTASSTRTPSLNGFECTIVTPSSECASPRSPEVTSPVGLGILPTVSPLLSTPIEDASFDIPEARHPLPASPPPEALSPVTVVLEVDQAAPQSELAHQTETIPPLSVSPFSVSSEQSYATSPQDPVEEVITALPPPEPKSIVTAMVTSPQLTPTAPVVNPNPLHCRVCLADSCDDITASMCGHIFCNRCITDAVIKTNRCPVCMTPTLLYCLFRLDLGA